MKENYLYRGVRGMKDVFPEECLRLRRLEDQARQCFARYGLGEIRTPLVEPTILFERGVGQETDIVNKEMFYVPAKDEDAVSPQDAARKMVLRPEATASVARAYIEHEISKAQPGPQRYFYMGPMFRYERPQRGRYRQFNQIGVELLGSSLAAVDAEAVILLHDLLKDFGVPAFELQINAVGCPECRPSYIEKLQAYARGHAKSLCADCLARTEKNPLRLFDCKQPGCRSIMAQAPSIQDFLCPACRSHQSAVVGVLQAAGIAFRLTPSLMRGLDYYTRTVFEVVYTGLGAQNAIAAGGRYDGLIGQLDGPATPAVGWSIGVERILEILETQDWPRQELDVYIVSPGPNLQRAFLQVLSLRRQGLRVGFEHEARSPKSLMKKADKLGARFVIFVSETDPDKVEIKNMVTGEQSASAWAEIKNRVQAAVRTREQA